MMLNSVIPDAERFYSSKQDLEDCMKEKIHFRINPYFCFEGLTMIDNNLTNANEHTTSSVPLIVTLGNPNDPMPDYILEHIQYLRENNICEFFIINSLKDLPAALSRDPDCFLFADDNVSVGRQGMAEFMMMLKTLISYTNPDARVKIGYLLEKSTPHGYIKELQRLGVTGVIPGMRSYDKAETTKALEALINGIPYWPKHLIEQLPGNAPKPKREAVHLTHRQQEVLELIANRGLSNKQIARVLGISESTVKIHVSAIMKAYCVRNRTQLALTKK